MATVKNSNQIVAVDGNLMVWGIGTTDAEALNDARSNWGDFDSDPADELVYYPASEGLIDEVERAGGVDGVDVDGILAFIDPNTGELS